MKFLLFGFLLSVQFTLLSQDKQANTTLLYQHVQSEKCVQKQNQGILFGFYKNVISDQILNDCIYDHSCSHFSKDVFKEFGLLKGLMLTADRLTRCNRATQSQISDMLKDDQGRALDHWDYYVKKK